MSRSGRMAGGAALLAAPVLTVIALRVLAGAIGALRALVLTAAAVPLVTSARSAVVVGRVGATKTV